MIINGYAYDNGIGRRGLGTPSIEDLTSVPGSVTATGLAIIVEFAAATQTLTVTHAAVRATSHIVVGQADSSTRSHNCQLESLVNGSFVLARSSASSTTFRCHVWITP